MEPIDLTIEILKSIRDEGKQTNVRLDELRVDLSTRIDELRVDLSTRIEEVSTRIDDVRSELSERIVHSEIRTATAITELAGDMREMTRVLKASVELGPRVSRCEKDISELRERIDRAPR